MTVQIANNATSRLATSITTSSTSVSVQAGDGAKFPSLSGGDTFPVTLIKADGQLEICRCTARVSDTLTLVRGQEGTVAKAFAAGDRVELRLTAGALNERLQEVVNFAATMLPNSGGNLSGDLTIWKTSPSLVLRCNSNSQRRAVVGMDPNNLSRWEVQLGNAEPETTGTNNGSNFSINSYTDAGVYRATPFSINRSTGVASFSARPTFNGATPWDTGNFDPASKQAAGSYVTKVYGGRIDLHWNNGLYYDIDGALGWQRLDNKATYGVNCVHNSVVVEFGAVNVNDAPNDSMVDLPSPYVMVGLRRSGAGVMNLRGIILRNQQ